MTALDSEHLAKLKNAIGSPAFRRARELAQRPDVSISGSDGRTQTAKHASFIWSGRLWNMRRVKRRFVGLPALLRALNALPPSTAVEQLALSSGLTTALVFYEADQHEPLGAVVSVRTPADVKRSWDNYRMANGETVEPARKRAVGSRREVKSSPAIAALQQ